MKQLISFITGGLLTWLSYFLGGWDTALEVLLIVIIADYITGVCNAIYKKKLNSKKGIQGTIKKVGYFVIVALAVSLDKITGAGGALRTLTIYFFVANEGISILENWGKLGLPLPKKLIEILEQLKNNGDK